MATVEYGIELAIKDSLASAIGSGHDVAMFCSREGEAEGNVLSNITGNAIAIYIKADNRSYERYECPFAVIPVTVSIRFIRANFPDMGVVENICEPVFAMFQGWQNSLDSASSSFSTGKYKVCGTRITGGENGFDEDSVTIRQGMELTGTITE